jgi:hypothetical protein
MRTTLDLPDKTFRALKAEASLRGFKLKELVTQFIESGLAARVHPSTLPQPQRSALPVIRKATGKVHPALSKTEIEDILSKEEIHVGH